MNEQLILIAWLYPLAGALAVLMMRLPERLTHLWVATAGIPALLLVLLVPDGAHLYIDWLLMGTSLEVHSVSRLFLLFTGLLWTIAGWYSIRYMAHDERRTSFHALYLLTLSGNIGLILAADVPLFYMSFAIMTFAAYGLVVHTRTPEAQRAGRIYIFMAVLGEAMILSAVILMASVGDSLLIASLKESIVGSRWEQWIIGLTLGGFGVKAGFLGLHMWLPLAHPVAPTPASAVLSGSMIKAGLLGWIYFLPGGEAAYPAWGAFCIAAGIAGALYAVIVGLMQTDPKTNLAYSSISQMGVMLIGLGIGLSHQQAWPLVTLVLCLYALNHALAKGALFLGVGVALAEGTSRARRQLILAGFALAALAIAGGPLTGGALAKDALKNLKTYAPGGWSTSLEIWLAISAIATTLLLTRFLFLIHAKMRDQQPHGPHGLALPWIGLFILLVSTPWIVSNTLFQALELSVPTLSNAWKSVWPILLGLSIALVVGKLIRRPISKPWIPSGDVVCPIERIAKPIAFFWTYRIATYMDRTRFVVDPIIERLLVPHGRRNWLRDIDTTIRDMEVSGSLFVILITLLFLAMLL